MKKIISVLCALLCVLSLCACSRSADEGLAPAKQDEIKQTASMMLMQCMQIDDTMREQFNEMRDADLDLMLLQYGIPCSGKDFKAIMAAWQSGQEEVGEIKADSLGDFTVSEKNGDVIVSAEADFSIRPAEIAFTFDEDGTVTSLTVGGHYTTGEILKKAGQNTLIGMGICFAVLTFIALIISSFSLFGKAGKKEEKKEEVTKAAAPAAPAQVQAPAKDDLEIIAVISAAIAAAEEGAPGRIRSIVKRSTGEKVYSYDPAQFDHVDGYAARSIRRRSGKWNR